MNSNRKRNMNSNRKRNLIAVEKLARKGLSTKQISKKTGLSIWTVCRHINFLGLSKKPTEEQKENELKEIKKPQQIVEAFYISWLQDNYNRIFHVGN